ncbi:hypothetical protein MROS_0434 [Melioribacter roseus P3M-2]|uniref:DUF4837 domain-containing protein n=1 Tax=Melioribacter roseus (strain DSM 23840 / JCM 17771 / VKM B-2668 / P3M-2) TaxID=1191523 RepID=I6YT04_MELRP|nr:DUF4837 family protein [Melioribacter roseus]AFN73677.1 hypothetical protein MROS_0434 [Melioribacter roseus P3M-2]
MKKRYLLLIPLLIALIVGCDAKKSATGNEDEIYVFADSTEYEQIEASLLTVFSKIIYTPQPENLFILIRKDISELDKYKNKKNIIITAPLGSGSNTSNYIDGLLNQQVKEMVRQDSVFVINKYDLWARGQLVMILTAKDLNELGKKILNEHENLLYYFQKISNERLFKSLYNSRYERKEIEAKLLKNYGWLIYVQADYHLAIDKPEHNFVWLRRAPGTDMERWIFVHWIDNASPLLLNKDSVYAIRNRITEKFYRTSDDSSYVLIEDNYRTTKEVNFLGRYALMTQGLWKMKDGSMGGPFINYTFYDEPTKRLYMLDASIYAPKYYKKKLIQQVDVLLQSFMTEREVDPEKKEELLEELE